MENMVLEQIREIKKVETEFSVTLQQPQNRSLITLKSEILKSEVENLKKENFSLKASVQAWRTTCEQKQNELREAESKLNEIYNQIWSEREEFCARADKFNNQYGISSKRWKEKMDEIFNPLSKKKNEDNQEKLQKLEMKVEEAQTKIEILEKDDKQLGIFVTEPGWTENFVLNRKESPKKSSSETDNKSKFASQTQENGSRKSSATFNESAAVELDEVSEKLESPKKQTNEEALESILSETNTRVPAKKKVRFSRKNETIEIFNKNPTNLKMKFFSIVDAETVRKANRFKNKRKNHFLDQAPKPGDAFI